MTDSSESRPSASQDQLPGLLLRIERREQTARRHAVLYSMLPIALTVLLLGYTARQVLSAQRQVDSLKSAADTYKAQANSLDVQVRSYREKVDMLQAQLTEAQKKLAAATDLAQYVRPISHVDAKELASRFPGSELLLLEILQLRQMGTEWKLGGQSPGEGFDSPSFAMYILRRLHVRGIEPRPGESLLGASRRLYENLPPIDQPHTGDLVFYPAGYALFYFDDPLGGPFVLGMTPFGITALKPNFANPIGYRHVQRP